MKTQQQSMIISNVDETPRMLARGADETGDTMRAAELRPRLLGDPDQQRLKSDVHASLFGAPLETRRVGRFRVLGPIGEGGMGVVYAAQDDALNRRVALKLLRCAVHGELSAARLQREAQALARLAHPNVVRVYETGTFEGRIFLAMELVEGETLARWQSKQTDWRTILAAYVQAGRGLAAAHAAGIVHRDFKPSNALVRADGQVLVLDFGLARAVSGAPSETSTAREPRAPISALTVTGSIMGTPAYMAPEQLCGTSVDERVDQFSFCVALHEALTGQRPFAGDDLRELLDAVLAGERQPFPASSRVPTWLRDAIVRGLARDPDERWPSMAALLDELTVDREAIRRRRLLAAAGVLVLGCSTAGAWVIMEMTREADVHAARVAAATRVAETAEASARRALTEAERKALAERSARANFLALSALPGREGEALEFAMEAVAAHAPDFADVPPAAVEALVNALHATRHTATLPGQQATRQLLAMAPTGSRLAVASGASAELIDLSTGALTRLTGHDKPIVSLSFAPDGSHVVSGSGDGTARIWDTSTATLQSTLGQPGDGTVWAVAHAPAGDRLATANADGTIHIHDAVSGRALADLAFTKDPRTLRFTADGARLIAGAGTGTVHVWDTRTWEPLARMEFTEEEPKGGGFGRLAASADGAVIVTGHNGAHAHVWDGRTGQHRFTLEGHELLVSSIAITADGTRAVTGSVDGTIRLWDTHTGTVRATLHGHHAPMIADLAFSPDESLLASAGGDNTARLWDASSGLAREVLRGHGTGVTAVAFAPSGGQLATVESNGTVRLWDIRDGKPDTTLVPEVCAFMDVSPDSRQLVTADADGTLSLRDPDTGDARRALPGHGAAVVDVAWAANGDVLAAAHADGRLVLWDTQGGRELAVHELALAPSKHVLFATFNATRIAALERGRLGIFDASTGRRVRALTTEPASPGRDGSFDPFADAFVDAVLSPDGVRALELGRRGAFLWSVDEGAALFELPHDDTPNVAAFSPDGRLVATGGRDGALRLWSVETGQLAATLTGHTDAIFGLSFDARGERVVSSSRDATARLWDVRALAPLHTFEGHESLVFDPMFARGGAVVVTRGVDRTLRLWDARAGASMGVLLRDLDESRAAVTLADKIISVDARGAVVRHGITTRALFRQGCELAAQRGVPASAPPACGRP